MTQTAEALCSLKCKPCEGGVDPMTLGEAQAQLTELDGWSLDDAGKMISKEWNLGTFANCLDAIQTAGEVAESEDHHPDLLLHGYRHLKIMLTTHAISGLSENDFIVAAKIDAALATG